MRFWVLMPVVTQQKKQLQKHIERKHYSIIQISSKINKLKKIEGVGTFLEDENGYKVTSPEGFVAIKDGAALKLVDRLEFSRANFTVAKDWGK